MGMDRLMVVIPDLVLDDYKIWSIVAMTIWQFIHFDDGHMLMVGWLRGRWFNFLC